jgi:microcompartment protein CcmK/EutM
MYLGRVIGTVVASREPQVAADATKVAGPRDLVYLVGSREASLALDEAFVPVDAAIVGIVDQVSRE